MSSYKLIVFDWDGTIMDSTGHIVYCMQQAISRLDLSPLDDSAIKHIIGLGLNEAALALYPHASKDMIEKLANSYRESWLENPHESRLFPNAHTLIQTLNKQDHFLAVATGKSRRGLDKAFAGSQLETFFHASRCADECHSKPHPQMIEELMDYCGVTPDETLMIGDTSYDLQMAHNAGTDSLGVSHGAHSTELLQKCQPKDIVNDLTQVQHWLANN